MTLDQTKPAQGANGFQSLGRFRFAAQEQAAVLYHGTGSRGIVRINAVQVVPVK